MQHLNLGSNSLLGKIPTNLSKYLSVIDLIFNHLQAPSSFIMSFTPASSAEGFLHLSVQTQGLAINTQTEELFQIPTFDLPTLSISDEYIGIGVNKLAGVSLLRLLYLYSNSSTYSTEPTPRQFTLPYWPHTP